MWISAATIKVSRGPGRRRGNVHPALFNRQWNSCHALHMSPQTLQDSGDADQRFSSKTIGSARSVPLLQSPHSCIVLQVKVLCPLSLLTSSSSDPCPHLCRRLLLLLLLLLLCAPAPCSSLGCHSGSGSGCSSAPVGSPVAAPGVPAPGGSRCHRLRPPSRGAPSPAACAPLASGRPCSCGGSGEGGCLGQVA